MAKCTKEILSFSNTLVFIWKQTIPLKLFVIDITKIASSRHVQSAPVSCTISRTWPPSITATITIILICDGSWECPGERAINTCARNSTTGCNYCDVYGQHAAGNTRFEIQQDCWRFDCECELGKFVIVLIRKFWKWLLEQTFLESRDGQIHEPSQLQVHTNLPNSWCTECTIGGSVYPGYSQLEYQEKCTRQYARCYCKQTVLYIYIYINI
jgi:hypothetical protein